MTVGRWTRIDQYCLEGVICAVPVVGVLLLSPRGVDAARRKPLAITETVQLRDPSAAQYAWSLLPGLLALAGVAVGAWLRLTALAVLVTVGGMLGPALADAVRISLTESALGSGRPGGYEFEISFWPALAGLFIFFVAEVFRRGAGLRAEVEGLV